MNVTNENAKENSGKNSVEAIFDFDAPEEEPLDEKKLKFSIYNEIKPQKKKTEKDDEWSLRLACTQEWFVRCSCIHKFLFLEILCQATEDCMVLENVLQSIESIHSKDFLESFSPGATNYCYDIIPEDDNRALDAQELNKAMEEDFDWFLNSNTGQQTRIILRLLRLGGGGLTYMVYKAATKIYQERQNTETLSSGFPKPDLKREERKTKNDPTAKIPMQNSERTKSLESENEASNESSRKKLKQLERREEELTKYKKLKGILVDDSKALKKVETKEAVDYLQILPIRLNRRIMSFVDDKTLSGFKRVGKYWGKMIDESINEKSGRKAINAKINKIIGIKGDKEEKKNEDKNEDKELEFITELGTKDLINRKNESEDSLIAVSKLFGAIFSRKCEMKSLDSTFYPERCGAYDNSTGLLTCSAPNNMIHLYSVRTGTRLNFLLFGLQSTVSCLALHENRIYVYIGFKDGSLISKDMRTNKTVASFYGHTKAVISIFTTPTNLLSASLDNTVKYFQVWSRLCLLCIDFNPEFNISSVLCTSDKQFWTAIGTVEGVLILTDVQSRKFLAKVKLHNEEIKHLAQDEDFLITGSAGGKIRVWNMSELNVNFPTLKPYYTVDVGSSLSCLKFYKNQILCGSENGTVKIISLATGKIFRTLKISSQTPITGLHITEDKLFMKLIIWHEKGIEIRSFSHRKLSAKKPSMERDDRESKQKAPKEIIMKNKTSEMVLSGHARKSQGLIEATANAYKRMTFSGIKKALNERCCTISSLRTRQRKPLEFNTDVFTETFNSNRLHSNYDFFLCTFPRNKI